MLTRLTYPLKRHVLWSLFQILSGGNRLYLLHPSSALSKYHCSVDFLGRPGTVAIMQSFDCQFFSVVIMSLLYLQKTRVVTLVICNGLIYK